jgi:hypothetical protein
MSSLNSLNGMRSLTVKSGMNALRARFHARGAL